jgi:hypothetical protein
MDRIDLRSRTDSLKQLQEMGFGRAREDEDKQSLLVKRTIVAPSLPAVSEPLENGAN